MEWYGAYDAAYGTVCAAVSGAGYVEYENGGGEVDSWRVY
jgi:hypothetical protein